MGVINAILPIMGLLALGYGLQKIWIKNDDFWKTVNGLIYYVMFPALIIKSVALADFSILNPSFIYVLMGVVLGGSVVIGVFKNAFVGSTFWLVFLQGSIRYNNYIFMAVALFYLGDDALPIMALIIGVLVLLINVIIVVMINLYNPHQNFMAHMIKATLFNPLVFACILGLLINYLSLYAPVIVQITWLNHTLGHLGTASLVLGLMAVGATLKFDSLQNHYRAVALCSVVKLLVMPALVVGALYALDFDNTVILVCAIYASAPCSPYATSLIQSVGGDYQSMSMMISVQTVLSIITMPVLLYLLSNMLL